jgi:hypothetical protein
MKTISKEYYEDWLSDNISSLRADFIEENFPDEFMNYCKKEFEEWYSAARLNNM